MTTNPTNEAGTLLTGEQIEPSVCIAWASRKRHIFIDGKLICEINHKPDYSRGGHYCSYTLSGLPTHEKEPDVDYPKGGGAHLDGIIPFQPLSEIGGIKERSICNKCLAKYSKLLAQYNLFKSALK